MRTDRMDDRLIEVPRGLTGVAVAETSISDVRGHEGYYRYRDHSAIELARASTFEDVWHLLVKGTIPDAAQRASFGSEVSAARAHPEVAAAVEAVTSAGTSDPIAGLKAALPLYSSLRGLRPVYDLDEAERVADAVEIAAVTPVILGGLFRGARGLDPLPDDPSLGVAANHLRQLIGHAPEPRAERALDAYLIALLDHGLNASTFTARVVASTGADIASCVAAGLGALTGPLHGGAPARALDELDEVAARGGDVESWVRAQVEDGRRVMGFGHAVYRTVDPRSQLMKEFAQGFGGARVEAAVRFEETTQRLLEELKPGRALHANVEFYAAVTLEACGIPRDMLTPTFAIARTVGWTAHVLEQAREGKIIRPSARFVGSEHLLTLHSRPQQ